VQVLVDDVIIPGLTRSGQSYVDALPGSRRRVPDHLRA
jgi:hypothetical protein